jgi:hypothetical protein
MLRGHGGLMVDRRTESPMGRALWVNALLAVIGTALFRLSGAGEASW